jgi:hypothetical protein
MGRQNPGRMGRLLDIEDLTNLMVWFHSFKNPRGYRTTDRSAESLFDSAVF